MIRFAECYQEQLQIMVYSGKYNKISLTGWLINHKKFFLIVLEARKFKIKASTVVLSSEGPLPCADSLLCVMSSHGERGQEISLEPLLEGCQFHS